MLTVPITQHLEIGHDKLAHVTITRRREDVDHNREGAGIDTTSQLRLVKDIELADVERIPLIRHEVARQIDTLERAIEGLALAVCRCRFDTWRRFARCITTRNGDLHITVGSRDVQYEFVCRGLLSKRCSRLVLKRGRWL